MRLLTKMMNKEEVEEKRLSCLMESKKKDLQNNKRTTIQRL